MTGNRWGKGNNVFSNGDYLSWLLLSVFTVSLIAVSNSLFAPTSTEDAEAGWRSVTLKDEAGNVRTLRIPVQEEVPFNPTTILVRTDYQTRTSLVGSSAANQQRNSLPGFLLEPWKIPKLLISPSKESLISFPLLNDIAKLWSASAYETRRAKVSESKIIEDTSSQKDASAATPVEEQVSEDSPGTATPQPSIKQRDSASTRGSNKGSGPQPLALTPQDPAYTWQMSGDYRDGNNRYWRQDYDYWRTGGTYGYEAQAMTYTGYLSGGNTDYRTWFLFPHPSV